MALCDIEIYIYIYIHTYIYIYILIFRAHVVHEYFKLNTTGGISV